jgi:hypothetical protein
VPKGNTEFFEVLVCQVRQNGSIDVVAKRRAYSDIPSLSSHFAISCTAAHSPAHLAMLRCKLSEPKVLGHFGPRRPGPTAVMRKPYAPQSTRRARACARADGRVKSAPAASASATQAGMESQPIWGRVFDGYPPPAPGHAAPPGASAGDPVAY